MDGPGRAGLPGGGCGRARRRVACPHSPAPPGLGRWGPRRTQRPPVPSSLGCFPRGPACGGGLSVAASGCKRETKVVCASPPRPPFPNAALPRSRISAGFGGAGVGCRSRAESEARRGCGGGWGNGEAPPRSRAPSASRGRRAGAGFRGAERRTCGAPAGRCASLRSFAGRLGKVGGAAKEGRTAPRGLFYWATHLSEAAAVINAVIGSADRWLLVSPLSIFSWNSM